jgi:hypothetical protein
MKRALPWIALALALMLGVAVCDGLRTRDGYSVLVGSYQEALKAANALNAEKDKVITTANGTITTQTAKIAELLGNAALPTEAEKAKDAKIQALNATLASVKTDAERVPVLEGLVVEWQDKFTLSETRRKDELTALNGEWQVKFDAQAQITEAWKAKYEAEHRVLSLSEKAMQLSNRKLKTNQIIGNIKTGALLTAAILVGVNALKGSK